MSQHRLRVLCALLVVVAAVFLWINAGRQAAKRRHQRVMEQAWILADALHGYEDAHDMALPPAANWEAQLLPYLADKHFSFRLPASNDGAPRRWVLERTVAGHSMADLRSPYWERVVFFEAPSTQSSATDTLAHGVQMGEDEEFVVVDAIHFPASISGIQRPNFLLQNQHPLATP